MKNFLKRLQWFGSLNKNFRFFYVGSIKKHRAVFIFPFFIVFFLYSTILSFLYLEKFLYCLWPSFCFFSFLSSEIFLYHSWPYSCFSFFLFFCRKILVSFLSPFLKPFPLYKGKNYKKIVRKSFCSFLFD